MANHYIRSGASGSNDGSSWANAWPTFAAVTWTRGDTYFVAGGTYSENVTVAKPLSGTTYIFVKKANLADNSGDAGWSASYASTVALIQGYLALNNGYVQVDGVTGGGTSGHGIKVWDTAPEPVVIFDSDGDHFRLTHTEVRGAGFSHPTVGYTALYSNTTAGTRKGYYVGYCWIHEASANGIITGAIQGSSYSDYGFIFENNVVSETGGVADPEQHGQGWQFNSSSYFIIRNNIFRNCVGSAMLAYLGGSGQTFDNQEIYNNIFCITDLTVYLGVSPGVIWMSSAAVSAADVLIANNTFYGLGSVAVPAVIAQVMINTPSKTNVVLKNNIWEFSNFTQGNDVNVESNNGYQTSGSGACTGAVPSGTTGQVNGSGSTFVSPASADFTIKLGGYAVGAGLDLSSVFTDDAAGLTRSVPWDLGAFRYSASYFQPSSGRRNFAGFGSGF